MSLLEREVERILTRKRTQSGRNLAGADIMRLRELIGNTLDALTALANELIIARRIAAATTTAVGAPVVEREDEDGGDAPAPAA